jgi:hypothetical protein
MCVAMFTIPLTVIPIPGFRPEPLSKTFPKTGFARSAEPVKMLSKWLTEVSFYPFF